MDSTVPFKTTGSKLTADEINNIVTAINSKQDDLLIGVNMDSLPSFSSNFPVTSNGVAVALASKGDVTLTTTQTLSNKTLVLPKISSILNGSATINLPTTSGTLALVSQLTSSTGTGINTGDETADTIKAKLGITTLSGVNTGDQNVTGIAVNAAAIGTLSSLSTSTKANLVAAINEVKAVADAAAGGGTVVGDGTVTNSKLATDVKVGSLAILTTSDKTSVVAAINELNSTKLTSGNVVTLTGTETLSNKTLTAPKISTILNSTATLSLPTTSGTLALASQITGINSGTNTGDQLISDATLTTSDILTNNVSILKHGFVPKAPNDVTKFLDGTGAWSIPAGSSGTTVISDGIKTKSFDYLIVKVGATYFAFDKTGNTLTSNTDAYTVIQAAITALTQSGSQGTGGGLIALTSNTYTLTNELTVTGWETATPPFAQLIIQGSGYSTRIQQNTANKNAFVVKNRASVVIRDMFIGVGTGALSAIKGDNNGTSEISFFNGSIDNVKIVSSGSAPGVYLKNFLSLSVPYLESRCTNNHSILLENSSPTVNYGNSHFGQLIVTTPANNLFAGLAITSTNTHPMNLNTFNSLIIGAINGYGQATGKGLYIKGGANNTFNHVDAEYMLNPIYFDEGTGIGEASNNTILSSYLYPTVGGTAIYTALSSSNNRITAYVEGDNSTITILDDNQKFRPANDFDLTIGSALDITKIFIDTPNETPIKVKQNGTGLTYIKAPNPTVGDNSQKIATTAFVTTAISGISGTSGGDVTLNGTQTLTNKTISGTSNTFNNIPASAIASTDTIIFDPNSKQNLITLTTTGTSGAATFNQSTGALNIPAYTSGGSGGSGVTERTILTALGAKIKQMALFAPYFPIDGQVVASPIYSGGEIMLSAFYFEAGTIVNGTDFLLTGHGTFTATGYNGTMLYSTSGGILTLRAQSANLPSIWTGADYSYISTNFVTAYTIPTSGIYYVGAMYSASVESQAPSMAQLNGAYFPTVLNGKGGTFTNNAFISGRGGYNPNAVPTTLNAIDIGKDLVPLVIGVH